jgi:transposase
MGTNQSRARTIQDLRGLGFSYRTITDRLHCSNRAISPKTGTALDHKKMGRPKKLTPEISQFIETRSYLDASLTNLEIMFMVNREYAPVQLSESSVSAERCRLGFTWRPPLVKQDLDICQEHERLQYAIDVLSVARLDTTRVVFSDESRFVLGDDNRWRHIRRGDWNETAFVTKTKFPISVMIWGAIGVGYKSGCIQCSNGVDAEEYQAIVEKSNMIDEMNERYGPFQWFFMQDGATAHTSQDTIDALKKLCLLLPGWPPNSPDLNPIEMVWAIMKLRVKKLAPKTKEELMDVINTVWNELNQEMLDRMVLSFGRRLELVRRARGRSISPYLSSHRTEPNPEDAAANPDWRAFAEEEDQLILQWVDRIGNRWKRITEILSQQFPPREKLAIKHRARWLLGMRSNLQQMQQPVVMPEEPVAIPEDPEEPEFSPETFFHPKSPEGKPCPVFARLPE